ncbi:WD40-repeat-containing domain protein [Obelidium mucronatum]|nr:WD40-repeat-containing domain protein [Obelidium mucronatum]
MSIDPEKRGKKNALAPESPFLGLSRWIFIPKWKITVIATLQLELKILSSSFENVASVSSVQPVLSFEFNEDTNELIAGGVGNIRVWGFEKPSNSLFPQGFTGPRLFISDLKANEWVTNVTIDKVFHRIFATVDNALFVYDYKTGRRLEVINGAHKSTISTMVFYQPLQYSITACTDGFIKVWTQQYRVLFELKDEASSPITGLLIPNAKESGSPSPFLISSAQDGVIRLWSLDSGSSIYMISTDNDCLGIRWMRQDTFLSYSQEGMSIWNLNRFFSTFSRTGSQVTHLKRIEGCKTEAARILVATEDRSMRILSPVRGATLFTAFPNMIEHQIKDIEHDIPSATMWMLSANGEVSVYTTETNPAKIVDIWEVEGV